jgi:chromosome partitioning protein
MFPRETFFGTSVMIDVTPFSIALVNMKGGCAKTGTTHQIAGCFAKMGLRVLLLDLDPQASLTQGFFGPEWTEARPAAETAVALFNDSFDPDPDKLLVETPCENITLLPGKFDLKPYNEKEPEQAGALQTAVRSFSTEVQDRFDVTLMDCPPNLSLCSWNALLACEFVVVPVQAEDFGAQGIVHIQRFIDLVLQKFNPNLRLLGYLITLRQPLAIHEAYEKQLRRLYGSHVFEHVFPHKKDYKEAIAERLPIHFLRPRSAAAKALNAIADEILRRIPDVRSRQPEFLHFENRILPQERMKEAS